MLKIVQLGVKCTLLISILVATFSVNAQQTLSGTISLPSGFAITDINLRVVVLELNGSNQIVSTFNDEVTVAANTGSVAYTIDNISAAPGNTYIVRYLCLQNTCGQYVSEVYQTPNGIQYEYTDNSSEYQINQLPPVLNFTLITGNTVSGTIFLPKASSQQLQITPIVQFVPGTTNRFKTQFFSKDPLLVAAGATQISFTVEGIPQIAQKLLVPFSTCANCEPGISKAGNTPNFDVNNQAATAIPSNQNHVGIQLFHKLANSSAAVIPPVIDLLLGE